MDALKLREQLCFPLYAASRMVTKRYTPFLEELDLTYPQYLCMLVLWEDDPMSVGDIGARLLLNSNTLTPLLKKIEAKGYVRRQRVPSDERTVGIYLTDKGRGLRKEAEKVPMSLIEDIGMPVESLTELREQLWNFLEELEDL